MVKRSTIAPEDERTVAAAREQFLSTHSSDSRGVRAPIKASWSRSRDFNVDAERLDLPYMDDPDLECPLARAALPALNHLAEQVQSQPVGVLLTDAHGMVLERRCGDRSIDRHLDRVWLAPGYSYAEQHVGTNGIGTALEAGAPTFVSGREHYADPLGELACGGAPIHHPTSGRLLGVLDLTSWADESSKLLLPMARTTAQRIERNLLAHTGSREVALLGEYLRTCQHTGGAVIALNEEITMINDRARLDFDAADQTTLLRYSSDALGFTRQTTLIAELPSGKVARMAYRPAYAGDALAGGVFHVQMRVDSPVPTPRASSEASTLPGVVGHSAVWQKASRAVGDGFRAGQRLALVGEPGVGKVALLRAVHQRCTPDRPFQVVTARQSIDFEAWIDTVEAHLTRRNGTLVITHVDQLDSEAVTALADLLTHHTEHVDAPHGTWVAVTLGCDEHNSEVDSQILPYFTHSVDIPPLRHHIEDLHELVPHLLTKLCHNDRVTVSRRAMQQLTRHTWPGNVAQLARVLHTVTRRRRSGEITVDDLPPESRSMCRRQLTQLESLERDAIIRSLVDNDGNKEQAAKALGVSRATIYRKIRDFGISL